MSRIKFWIIIGAIPLFALSCSKETDLIRPRVDARVTFVVIDTLYQIMPDGFKVNGSFYADGSVEPDGYKVGWFTMTDSAGQYGDTRTDDHIWYFRIMLESPRYDIRWSVTENSDLAGLIYEGPDFDLQQKADKTFTYEISELAESVEVVFRVDVSGAEYTGKGPEGTDVYLCGGGPSGTVEPLDWTPMNHKMYDDGVTEGDEVAGDNIYTATVVFNLLTTQELWYKYSYHPADDNDWDAVEVHLAPGWPFGEPHITTIIPFYPRIELPVDVYLKFD